MKKSQEEHAALEMRPLYFSEVRLMNHTDRICEGWKCMIIAIDVVLSLNRPSFK